MKKTLKFFLQKNGLYYKLRYSVFFRAYQYLFKQNDIEAEKKEVEFYKSFLPPGDLIFDIGANDGHKTQAFLQLAKRVVSCEPDKKNFNLLTERFRSRKKRVILSDNALSDSTGKATLFIHHPGSAFNTLSSQWKQTLEKDNLEKWNEKIIFSNEETVRTITLDDLIKKYGKPYFIKIDVEGYEENVLKGLSQPVPFLSFEGLVPEGYRELNNCLDRINYLDPTATYNLAAYEKLILPTFVNRVQLLESLQKNLITHLEVIVKMNAP